jgi:flagellar biogenesis protein FliO
MLVFGWLEALAAGAAESAGLSSPPPPIPGIGLSVIRLVGALALVLAIFAGGIWLARNWRRFVVRQHRNADLRVLEVRSLGPRQAIWVVAYQRQRLLLGSSPAGLSLLMQLPEGELEEPHAPARIDFAEAFRHVLNRGRS